MSEPDLLKLPDDWRTRALESLRKLEPELRELSWELAWREGWTQCAELASKVLKDAPKSLLK